METIFSLMLLALFGGVFLLALSRGGRNAEPPVAVAVEPSRGNGNIAILFFIMLAMMFVMMEVVKA